MSEPTKNGLVPMLRFPEFRDEGEWEEDKLANLIITVTPPQKLPTALYQAEGLFPIIDQSQSYICGWTNNQDALITEDLPLIIFGDHTCALKKVDVPFAQGADGIKILKTKHQTETSYLYQYLLFNPVVMEEYKRHFSILKEKLVSFPKKESGEQKKIVGCLSSIDELVTAQTNKVEALKVHKKGLMQQLFPAEGETVPKLRFPEFRDAREWEEVSVESCFEHLRNGFVGTATPYYVSDGIPYLQGKNIKQGQIDSTGLVFVSNEFHQKQKKSQLKANDLLMVQSGHVGECALVSKRFIGSNCHALIVMSPKKTIHSAFIKNFFYSPIGKQRINEIKTGNTIEHILVSDLKLLTLTLPSIFEQQKIADCLSSIDDLIAAQTQKLAALKAHKKGLMQQLFPAVDLLTE